MTKSLQELADDACYAISDLYTDDEFDAIREQPAVEQIKRRYLHADCDDFAFALNVLTDWEIVAVSCSSKGPLHRLNRDSEGRLVDISGFVTEEDLRKRYKSRKLSIAPADEGMSLIDDDEQLKDVIAVIPHLPYEPFTGLAAQAQAFIASGKHFDEDDSPSATASGSSPTP